MLKWDKKKSKTRRNLSEKNVHFTHEVCRVALKEAERDLKSRSSSYTRCVCVFNLVQNMIIQFNWTFGRIMLVN